MREEFGGICMRLKKTDEDNAKKTMDIYITNENSDIKAHPSYRRFVDELKKAGTNEDTSEELWEMLISGFRDMHNRGDSSGFERFAKISAELGLLSTGKEELALWSGGFQMSILAQKFGYCTLEKTIIGKILDSTPFTSLWDAEKNLWNQISTEFINAYEGTVVHVYVQVGDDASVLSRQEIPQLKKMGKDECVHWHPICVMDPKKNGSL